MVEWTCLENKRTFTGTVGSNPTLSATDFERSEKIQWARVPEWVLRYFQIFILTMISSNISKKILLLGAGFTHNFGTPLAKGIWYELFNRKDASGHPRIMELMLETKNYDFEKLYNEVLFGDYSESEKKVIVDAILETYESIDETVRNWSGNVGSQNALNIHKLQKFLSEFAGNKGFIFTLNQDLFLERHHYNGARPQLPGIQVKREWFSAGFRKSLSAEDYCQLPSSEELDKKKDDILRDGNFFYIKLHGSQNWLDSKGTKKIVLGTNKIDQINSEPLLSWYYKLFEEVLKQKDIELMVIGYGFGDAHINSLLSKGVKQGLTIQIISPQSIEDFGEELEKKDEKHAKRIYNAIRGYYHQKLSSIFPADQSTTEHLRIIYKKYFNKEIVV